MPSNRLNAGLLPPSLPPSGSSACSSRQAGGQLAGPSLGLWGPGVPGRGPCSPSRQGAGPRLTGKRARGRRASVLTLDVGTGKGANGRHPHPSGVVISPFVVSIAGTRAWQLRRPARLLLTVEKRPAPGGVPRNSRDPPPGHWPFLSGPWWVLATPHARMCWGLGKAGIFLSLSCWFSQCATSQGHLKSAGMLSCCHYVPSAGGWRVKGDRGSPGRTGRPEQPLGGACTW